MLFLKISNANVSFDEKILTWGTYTTNKALFIIKQVKVVDPKKFVIAALNVNSKTFVVYVAIREREEMPMHSKKQAQVGVLLFDKALTEVPAEYSNYSNVFLAENAAELPDNIGINEYDIEMEESKQPPFGLIYNLGPIELKTLKTYIKTNLANGFIWPSKSPVRAPFFWIRSQIKAYAFVWIIGVLTILQWQNNICCLWLASCSIGLAGQRNTLSWILPIPIIE